MLYSDGVHLVSDLGTGDLHRQCSRMGIKRCWFHRSERFPHYDIPKRRREGFFQAHPDVKYVNSRQIVALLDTLR